jgi:hypothetical protein
MFKTIVQYGSYISDTLPFSVFLSSCNLPWNILRLHLSFIFLPTEGELDWRSSSFPGSFCYSASSISTLLPTKAAVLFNNQPDDIAASLENIHKLESAAAQQVKTLEEQLQYPDLRPLFDTLTSLNRQNESLTNDLATLENYRAIELYFARQLPLFEKVNMFSNCAGAGQQHR